jgi:Histidine kinase-, DNA gyrase B-, and HSP90-like ATPase
MRNIAEHLLDITQNAVEAKATEIYITLAFKNQSLHFSVEDNGLGMDQKTIGKAMDPFFTTRKTRKIGLGIPLLLHNCKSTHGTLNINSVLGKGTSIEAVLHTDSIDMIPNGDIAGAASLLICNHAGINIQFTYKIGDHHFSINTKTINNATNGMALHTPEMRRAVKEIITEGIIH